MDVPPVGSLVVPAPSYRAAMGTGEGAALLTGLKRGSGNLYYPAPDRSFWVPMRSVRAIPAQVVGASTRERLLSELLLFLGAEECTIDAVGEHAMKLRAEGPALSKAQLEELRRRWGDRLWDYAIHPGSMRVLCFAAVLVPLPGPFREGR